MDLFNNLFEDDIFQDIIDETLEDSIIDIYKLSFGDLLIYNKNKNCLDTLSKQRLDKEKDLKIYGIIIKENNDTTIDLTMKNFLTKNSIIIPYDYVNKHKNMMPYIYLLFNRYCNKLKRLLNINIFNYYIPYIAQLDYIFQNKECFESILQKIWNAEKYDNYIKRFYNNGIICQHKGTYYQWKPIDNYNRKILHLDILTPYEFLPFFTLTYKEQENPYS